MAPRIHLGIMQQQQQQQPQVYVYTCILSHKLNCYYTNQLTFSHFLCFCFPLLVVCVCLLFSIHFSKRNNNEQVSYSALSMRTRSLFFFGASCALIFVVTQLCAVPLLQLAHVRVFDTLHHTMVNVDMCVCALVLFRPFDSVISRFMPPHIHMSSIDRLFVFPVLYYTHSRLSLAESVCVFVRHSLSISFIANAPKKTTHNTLKSIVLGCCCCCCCT